MKGHYVKDCQDPKQPKNRKKDKKRKNRTDSAAVAIACESKPVTVANNECGWTVRADYNCATHTGGVRWSLDLSCTIHPTPICKSFDKYEAIPIGQRYVTVGNGYRMTVIRVGTVRLQMMITDQSNRVLIKNIVLNVVLYAPESKEFLIPVPCLTDSGFEVKFHNVETVITGKHAVEGTTKREDRMCVIDQYNDSKHEHILTTGDIHL